MLTRNSVFVLILVAMTSGLTVGAAFADPKDVAVSAAVGAPDTVAIVIGIDKYDSPKITALEAAVADAKAFAKALRDRRGAETNVKLLTSDQEVTSPQRPTKFKIVQHLEWAERAVNPTDTFILYFAGHGINRWGKSYLLPIDAETSSAALAAMSSLSLDDLQLMLGAVKCAHQIVIMDCCRNDPETGRGQKANAASSALVRDIEIVGRAGAREAGAKSSSVLFSCSLGERAYERTDGKNGVFTHYLVRGLEGAAARAGEVTFNDLAGYVEENVPIYFRSDPSFPKDTKQTPWHKSEGSGRVVLATIAGPGDFEDVLKPAMVTITSDPPGAEVIFDGKPTGWKTPCTMPIENLTAGPEVHEFGVRLKGYVEQAKRGTIVAGAKPRLDFGKLVALAPPKREGERDVIVTPVGPRPPVGDKPWTRPGTHAGQEITGPDGGVMVWVPPGEFMMGAESWADDEKPVHRVRITKGFWVGKCEVTNEQYAKFLNEYGKLRDVKGNRLTPNYDGYWVDEDWGVEAGPDGWRAKQDRERHPVVDVDWEDAKAYCDHYGLALPTEAQWEYAARGEKGLRFPWGNEWDAKKCCNYRNRSTGKPPTMEVASLPAGNSWCGVCEMAGNVEEWCGDWYDSYYYGKSPSADPTGPSSGTRRVVRGGSWLSLVECYAADRDSDFPNWDVYCLGFRVSRTF